MNKLLLILLSVFVVQVATAKDTVYVQNQFRFQLRSKSTLLTDTTMRFSTNYPECREYRWTEWKSDEIYVTEITVIDFRLQLQNKSQAERDQFINQVIRKEHASHFPWPDTTQLFRGNRSIQGAGKYAEPKGERYKYIKFVYGDMLYTLHTSDHKKKVNKSHADFISRFELL